MATILYRILVIYILLSLSIRIMGKRQVGELEVSDLISTLLLSEIAALPVADPEIPLLYAVIPLIFILSLELLITCLKNRFACFTQPPHTILTLAGRDHGVEGWVWSCSSGREGLDRKNSGGGVPL